jgi:hypothetical protein
MIGNDPFCSFVAVAGKRGQGNKCKQSCFSHCAQHNKCKHARQQLQLLL